MKTQTKKSIAPQEFVVVVLYARFDDESVATIWSVLKSTQPQLVTTTTDDKKKGKEIGKCEFVFVCQQVHDCFRR